MYGTDTTVNEELVKRVNDSGKGKLCIHRNGAATQIRRYNTIEGFGLDHNLGVYNNSVDTIGRALTERYFYCADKVNGGFRDTITPIKRAFGKQHFEEFHNNVMANMPALPRLSHQQVVDRYTGSKRIVYGNAMISLSRCGIKRKDSHLKMFTKFEKQDLSKAPRGINPRDPRYNLELGRYLKHAEKPFFKAINVAFGAKTDHTVIKGLNAFESASVVRQKWDRFNNPVAVGLDAEKFDAHVTVQALKYEHSFYTSLFPGSKGLKELLSWQLNNRGVAYSQDGKVEFKIQGTRSSGDLNTSLGNCLIMCSSVYAYAKQRGVDIELCNNGDDCVVIMESDDLAKFQRGLQLWFQHRGFSMVAEPPVFEFEQIEFCQTKPVMVDGEWMLVRNHNAVLKKDPMCLIAIQNDKVYRKWLHAVGTCGTILNQGVPVQEAFYQAFLRNGTESTLAMREHVFKGTSMMTRLNKVSTQRRITPAARVSYYYAFGILPDEQVQIEEMYNSSVILEWTKDAVSRDAVNLQPGLKLLDNEISW